MDLQQTVQDLAEAWVAASTDTSFSRTQLQVYGTQGEDDSTSEGGGGGEPSTSADTGHTSAPPSPPAQPTGDGGLLASSSSHSRKRKQSSPQPRREEAEAAAAAPPAPSARSTSKGNPPPLKRPKETEGKMLPVHCVVERLDTPPSQDSDGKNGEAVEEKRKKGYAIVPSSLQLRNLVRVALSKLDYPPDKAKNATGVIQVRNWKALPFSSITDNQQSSVGQLFGDLLSHITLKITILSSDIVSGRQWTDQAVRCTVVELLKDYNQSKLAQISPLSQSMISYIANAKYKASISSEKCEEFGRWYQQFSVQRVKRPDQVMEGSSPKVTFHPTQEVPLLREWYRACQHPSEPLLHQYRAILNSTALRHGPKRPVELVHLKNWWKNERAKHKKYGSGVGPSPGPSAAASVTFGSAQTRVSSAGASSGTVSSNALDSPRIQEHNAGPEAGPRDSPVRQMLAAVGSESWVKEEADIGVRGGEEEKEDDEEESEWPTRAQMSVLGGLTGFSRYEPLRGVDDENLL